MSSFVRRSLHLVVLVSIAVSLVACGAARPMKLASAPMAPSAVQPAPVPIDRSLFARDPGGQLTEDALQ